MQYRAVIPEGVKPGTVVCVRASGAVVNVRIPMGNPGDTFLFEVPHQTIKEAQAATNAAKQKSSNKTSSSGDAASAAGSSAAGASPSSTAGGGAHHDGGTGGINEEPITASGVVAAGATAISSSSNASNNNNLNSTSAHKRKASQSSSSASSQQQQQQSSLLSNSKHETSKKKNMNNNNNNKLQAEVKENAAYAQLFLQSFDYICSNIFCCGGCSSCFGNVGETLTQLSDFYMAVLFGVCIGLSILMGFVLGILSVTCAASSNNNNFNTPTVTFQGVNNNLRNIELRTSSSPSISSSLTHAAVTIGMDGTAAATTTTTTHQVIVDTASLTAENNVAGQYVAIKGLGDVVHKAATAEQRSSKVTTTINAEGKTVIRIQGVQT